MPKREATRSMSLTSQESYSAVIIADMVAEVQSDPEETQTHLNRSNSNSSRNRYGSFKKKSQEQTNLGYNSEPIDSSPPAVVDVELEESTVCGLAKQMNGSSDISKGVILNATQFGHADTRLGPDGLKPGKALELNKLSVPDAGKYSNVKEFALEFNQMSLARKIAFGFSFLPSVMFVLCFAVILPCKEPVPCVHQLWSRILNNTEVTSEITLSENVFYTFVTAGENFVGSIDANSGVNLWNKTLQGTSHFVDCGLLSRGEHEACLVMEDSGVLHLFNTSNTHELWRRFFNRTGIVPSAPTILSDCSGDGVAEIGLGVSESQIKILMNGVALFNVDVAECGAVPSKLTPWHRGNVTDLIFMCVQENEEKLMKIPESKWCPAYGQEHMAEDKILTLYTGKFGTLTRAIILPTEDGLILWTDDRIIKYGADGEYMWETKSANHSTENRVLLFGKFNDTSEQLAAFSSDLRRGLRITVLDFANSQEISTTTFQNTETTDVVLVHGKKKDFALVSLRKAKSDSMSEAMEKISSVSTTLLSVLAKEDVVNASVNTPSRISEELAFLEIGGKFFHTIEQNEASYKESSSYRTSIKVVPRGNDLAIFVLRKSSENSQLRRIDVANWDISDKESACIWKQ